MSTDKTWTDEDLSQLMDAELDFEQAKQLREDLETDPDLAARWEKMLRLDADLSALDEHSAPSHLDQSILENAPAAEDIAPPSPPSRRWAYVLLAAGVLLAATPLLALTDWAQEPNAIAVASGSQWVSGPTQVLLPDGQTLQVDGRALISVEPPTPLPRVWPQEVEMNPKILLAAAAGAAITITVYEGRAQLQGPDGQVEVAAGETHNIPGRAPNAGPRSTLPRLTIDATIPELPEDVQTELDQLRLKNQFLEGQLSASGIRPNEWPEDLPAHLEPDALTAMMESKLKEFPDLKLMDVDCSEYPCMMVIEDLGEEPDRMNMEPMREAVHADFDSDLDSRVSGAIFQAADGGRYIEVWALMVTGADEGTTARTDMRAQEILMAAGEQED
ncbi:MAG: anti-sigma factor RsiW [Cognaticolwellia sp.]|jgi:anti-sigma factor RsiW